MKHVYLVDVISVLLSICCSLEVWDRSAKVMRFQNDRLKVLLSLPSCVTPFGRFVT